MCAALLYLKFNGQEKKNLRNQSPVENRMEVMTWLMSENHHHWSAASMYAVYVGSLAAGNVAGTIAHKLFTRI